MAKKLSARDAATRHQILIQRKGTAVAKQLQSHIKQMIVDTQKYIIKYDGVDNLSRDRYREMLKGLKALNRSAGRNLSGTIKSELLDFAKYEAKFTKMLTDKSITTTKGYKSVLPSTNQLKAAITSDIGGKKIGKMTIGQAIDKFSTQSADAITNVVRSSFSLGKTIKEITEDISAFDKSVPAWKARTIARTSTNHVAAVARDAFYQENKDIITSYEFVATIDDRTTEECSDLNGKVFSFSEFPFPPIHWNCRSTFVGVIDPDLGVEYE